MGTRSRILTTQPGWAFTSMRELRAKGCVDDSPRFYHRDSTAVQQNPAAVWPDSLNTPSEVFGHVISASARSGVDATRILRKLMRPADVKQAVLDWLPMVEGTRPRRYSITCEILGRTSLSRSMLDRALDRVIRAAFPAWRRASVNAVRLLCKADPSFGFVGVQIHSNLGDDHTRPGALRMHLASSLLQLAGVDSTTTVIDPFMGTGAVLDAAMRLYDARASIGFDVDDAACQIAARRLVGQDASIVRASFNTLDIGLVDAKTRLVTNAPFGVRFPSVDTTRLIDILRRCSESGARIAMLASREQGREASAALRLRCKNVIVMGQPASIVYEVQ